MPPRYSFAPSSQRRAHSRRLLPVQLYRRQDGAGTSEAFLLPDFPSTVLTTGTAPPPVTETLADPLPSSVFSSSFTDSFPPSSAPVTTESFPFPSESFPIPSSSATTTSDVTTFTESVNESSFIFSSTITSEIVLPPPSLTTSDIPPPPIITSPVSSVTLSNLPSTQPVFMSATSSSSSVREIPPSSTSSEPAAPTSTAEGAEKKPTRALSDGSIVGIIVALGVLFFAAIFLWLFRMRRKRGRRPFDQPKPFVPPSLARFVHLGGSRRPVSIVSPPASPPLRNTPPRIPSPEFGPRAEPMIPVPYVAPPVQPRSVQARHDPSSIGNVTPAHSFLRLSLHPEESQGPAPPSPLLLHSASALQPAFPPPLSSVESSFTGSRKRSSSFSAESFHHPLSPFGPAMSPTAGRCAGEERDVLTPPRHALKTFDKPEKHSYGFSATPTTASSPYNVPQNKNKVRPTRTELAREAEMEHDIVEDPPPAYRKTNVLSLYGAPLVLNL